MDKDLEELQSFANNLNRKPEERPWHSRRTIGSKNEMFTSATKKLQSKMNSTIKAVSATSIIISSGGSKKD